MTEPHRDANGYLLSAKIPTQRVTNESWPYSDSKGQHARGIDDQPPDKQLDVDAHLILDTDGEVILPGRAVRWNRSHVMVIINDPRLLTGMVWLRAHDVRRRPAS